ncbi:MAG: UDP-glucose 4-epimerase GalE, partial [Candidatus Thiodiazotropha taylori]|nr:UDP-glucose 4-epimerase GalE [Candidatus Thiodiazotropha taylori]
AHGSPLNIIEAERRAGDPPELVAGAEKVREVLGWSPKYDDLSVIASSALAWEQKQLNDPWTN